MRKLLPLLLVMLSFSFLQAQIIESFDSDLSQDSTIQFVTEGGASRIDFALNTTDKMEGTGAGQFKFVIGSHHQWGSFAQVIKRLPEGQTWDWTINDSLAIWIKVLTPPVNPTLMVFRIHIADRPSPSDPIEEYIYEHTTILDNTTSWVEFKVPLRILDEAGNSAPNDSGFVVFPLAWGGGSYNNNHFDADKIVGFNLAAVVSGWDPNANLPADSLEVMFDGFRRFGVKAIPAVVFNGVVFPSYVTTWAWGQSAIEVVEGAGPVTNSNAIKWTQGNEWGNGWTGWGCTIDPPFNLAGAWQVDSAKIKIKCPPGTGPLRIQYEGGPGKVGTVFQPIDDNQWHQYYFPLREMVYQDNTSGFDSSSVQVVGLMAEASGQAGRVLWITDWWTGNPTFDVIAPVPPTGVSAFPGTFQNIVTWQDVPGETGEKYDIYYSKNPITNVNDPGVEVVKLGVAENTQLIEHLLFAPVTNQDVTYYYAVVCRDASGNASSVSANSSAITNTAKGVTTISLNAPTTTFNADGDLSEWAAITPFRMFPSDGTGHIVTNTTINGDNDLSVLSYVAVDNQYLYVAFDVNDDIVVKNAQPQSYLNDAPDIFLGLYNWHGAPHTTYKRGAQPDYHIRFAWNRVILDQTGGTDSLVGLGSDYYWEEKFPSGYVVEFRVKWTDLAAPGGDNVFVPVEGYRIPIDYSINDADATGQREGILTYSPFNEDQSWNNVSRWLYTWIGSLWEPNSVDDNGLSADNYALAQNYPNPFNPTTNISYSIKEAGFVSLKVYDVLGREVATLVNENQTPGVYTVPFNASNLSSGMYLYRLETGSFVKVNKMMLLK